MNEENKEVIELLTVEETAQKLRISESYLYKLMAKDKINPINIGGRTLFKIYEINKFILKQENETIKAKEIKKKQKAIKNKKTLLFKIKGATLFLL